MHITKEKEIQNRRKTNKRKVKENTETMRLKNKSQKSGRETEKEGERGQAES